MCVCVCVWFLINFLKNSLSLGHSKLIAINKFKSAQNGRRNNQWS